MEKLIEFQQNKKANLVAQLHFLLTEFKEDTGLTVTNIYIDNQDTAF